MQVDWNAVISELKPLIPMQQLACRVRVNRTALYRWKSGEFEPHHSNGERLISQWIKLTGKTRSQCPEI